MIFLDTAGTHLHRGTMLALDAQVFGPELLYSNTPQVHERLSHPMSIYASALSAQSGQMVAYLSVTVVCESYYQKLLRGQALEEEFEPWDEFDTPLLFVRNLVVRDRRATPYLFRSVLKQLHQLFVDYDLYIHRAFTIASHWATRRALANYQFQPVGLYQGKYPILLANRDDSIVLNSLLKRYQS